MFKTDVATRGSFACLTIALLLVINTIAFGQGTAFTYQGRLSDSGNVANGNYDMQFKLFDTATVGTGVQQGSTLLLTNITVTSGLFVVQLDFGGCASCFNGGARFLEIAVKPTSGPTFTTLGPRQPVTPTPNAIRSQNAATADALSVACMNCVTSSQIQSVQGTQLTGAIPVASVPAGSVNYIQNTISQQAASNFNISGNGTAGGMLSADIVSATTHYAINGSRVLSMSAFNLFAGVSAGNDNTTGGSNSYFGRAAGMFNTTGDYNSFFGHLAGQINFGSSNSAFGYSAGMHSNGDELTIIGARADVNLGSNPSITNATAIGARATVGQSNSLVLGSINGVNGATADTKVGIGTTAPLNLLTVGQPEATLATGRVGIFSPSGLNLVLRETTNDVEGIFGANSSSGVFYGSMTDHAVGLRTNNMNRIFIESNGNVGIGTTAPDQLLTVNGGASKPGGGSWAVFSDQRLKTVKGSFTAGLNEVMRLQPVRYEYTPDNPLGIRASGEQIGFAAQEVERVIPEAVIRNQQGYLLVNNDPIIWAMLNAIKELRSEKDVEIAVLKAENHSLRQRLDQLSNHQSLLRQLQIQIEGLKRIVCLNHQITEVCK